MRNYLTDCKNMKELDVSYAKTEKFLHAELDKAFQEIKDLEMEYHRLHTQGYKGKKGGKLAEVIALNDNVIIATVPKTENHKTVLGGLVTTKHEVILEKDFDFKASSKEFNIAYKTLKKMKDLDVTLVDTWFWVTGATKEHKEEIKKLGLHWARVKKMWYYAPKKVETQQTLTS